MTSRSLNISEFMDLWHQGDDLTNYYRNSIVLVLGNRNVAKEKLIQFLISNSNDNVNQIEDVTAFQPSSLPVQLNSLDANSTIFDFDLFNEINGNVGLPSEIPSLQLLQKTINASVELKILLTIKYSSKTLRMEKDHFTSQIRYIASWLKNIDNYTESIGLIVTNVANSAENETLTNADQIFDQTTSVLEQIKKEYAQNLSIKKLIEILLKKSNATDYERIGVFRRSNQQIPLKDKTLGGTASQKIKTLVNNLKFSTINTDDFIYPPREAFQTSITSLTEKIDNIASRKIYELHEIIQKEFEKEGLPYKETRKRLEVICAIRTHEILLKSDAQLGASVMNLKIELANLNIQVPSSILDEILRSDRYLKFLNSINAAPLALKEWAWKKQFDKILNYIDEFRNWCSFLEQIEVAVSSYTVQKNRDKVSKYLLSGPITNSLDKNLQQFIEENHKMTKLSTVFNQIKNQKFSSIKVVTLEKVLRSTLQQNNVTFENDTSSGVHYVFADFIVLSDVLPKLQNQKYISLNAANKIFIDTNLERYDGAPQAISIIAPSWEVIGDVHIVLDGKNAGSISNLTAEAGKAFSENGKNGLPGGPGESAGHFFGIADIITGGNLHITANGGDGGPGQAGGAGAAGKNGESPVWEGNGKCERAGNFDSFPLEELGGFIFHDYCAHGRAGSSGGRGGNGGVGGIGGFAGNVTFIGLSQDVGKIQSQYVDGKRGADGAAGAGGKAGETGKSWKVSKRFFGWADVECSQSGNDYCGGKNPVSKSLNGANGVAGNFSESLKKAEKITFPQWSVMVQRFRQFFLKNLRVDTLWQDKKLTFLQTFNENISIRKTYADLYPLVDEFLFMDREHRLNREFNWMPHFEQLLYHVELYLNNSNNTSVDQEVAKLLQEAMLAKLMFIKSKPMRTFIVKLKDYLKIVQTRIRLSELEYRKNEVRHKKSELKMGLNFSTDFVAHHPESSKIVTNIANVIKQIQAAKQDSTHMFNKSFTEFSNDLAIYKVLVTLENTLKVFRSFEIFPPYIIKASFSTNKYIFKDLSQHLSNIRTIHYLMLTTPETEFTAWKETLVLVLKELEKVTHDEPSVKGVIKQCQEVLAETKPESLYKNKIKIRQIIRGFSNFTENNSNGSGKIISLEQRIQTIWFTCELQPESCKASGSSGRKDVIIQNVIGELVFSKIMYFSDKVEEIRESLFGQILEHPQNLLFDVHLLHVPKYLKLLQKLVEKMKECLKLPLSKQMEISFVAFKADAQHLIGTYEEISYYQELSRLETVPRLTPTGTSKSNSAVIHNLENSRMLNFLQNLYERKALYPFYKANFPFAYLHAKNIEITVDDYQSFKRKANETFETMFYLAKDYLPEEKTWLVDRTHHTFDVIYRWDNSNYGQSIKELLQGKEIILKSDISAQPPNTQALKIRRPTFAFQSRNETIQKELDRDLETFGLEYTTQGYFYYKCRDNIYTMDYGSLPFSSSFSSHNGAPISSNLVYEKFADSECGVSPYTTWRIQMETRMIIESLVKPLEILEKYMDSVDLVLKAEYAYLVDRPRPGRTFIPNSSSDYCDAEKMHKYYKNDDVTMYLNSTIDNELIDSADFASHIPNSEILHRKKRNNDEIDEKGSNAKEPIFLNLGTRSVANNISYGGITDGTNGNGQIESCLNFEYGINDCLLLLDLLVRRVTHSKPNYFQDCSINYSKARYCALNIVKQFEELLKSSNSLDADRFDFDPVILMEMLETDIIKNNGKNVGTILIEISSRASQREYQRTFYELLWDRLVTNGLMNKLRFSRRTL